MAQVEEDKGDNKPKEEILDNLDEDIAQEEPV